MRISLLGAVGGALVVAGVVVGVVALAGTTRPPRPTSPLRQWLARTWRGDGLGLRERRLRQGLLIGAILIGAVVWLVTGMPVLGLLAAAAVIGVPWLFTVGAAERRAIARIEAVGEWTRRLTDISNTGVGLQQAIVVSATTAPTGVNDEVGALAARLQAGWNARAALLVFADEIADPACDQVVAALILHLTDRGEHLGEMLSAIAAASAAEAATRREVEAKRTQPRFAVRFLTVLTIATVGYGGLRPDYMRPYSTVTGQLVMLGLGTAFVVLLLWVRSMSAPPQTVRFLRATGDGVDR